MTGLEVPLYAGLRRTPKGLLLDRPSRAGVDWTVRSARFSKLEVHLENARWVCCLKIELSFWGDFGEG